jgi:hypothetical protein
MDSRQTPFNQPLGYHERKLGILKVALKYPLPIICLSLPGISNLIRIEGNIAQKEEGKGKEK